jgi:serine/threonine protein kinase
MQNEMNIGGTNYPIVLMDWIDGVTIGKYVTLNQTDATALTSLQQKLIALSNSLTNNKIGHGDLQSGNILISKNNNKLKLIDYDGMYVPSLAGRRSIELGRPEYQHPGRNKNHYDEKIDWFSIWVMITAIEAVKIDPNLWNRKSQGGFNSQENFLFLGDDFINPEQSNLFNILLNKNDKKLQFYIKKLLAFCAGGISAVEKPTLAESLYPGPNPSGAPSTQNENLGYAAEGVPLPQDTSPTGKFSIKSNPSANVLTKSLRKISTTPCELDKAEYAGKSIILNYSGKTKTIELRPEKDSYSFDFI